MKYFSFPSYIDANDCLNFVEDKMPIGDMYIHLVGLISFCIEQDIRRSIPGNLRPLMTNIPASSMYSVRSGHTRSRTVSVSDSPLATSSNASSEMSVNNNGLYLDGIELEDDIGSERGGRSPQRSR